jgi:hypothetical protein
LRVGGRRAQQRRGIGGGDRDKLAPVSGSTRRWRRRPESTEAAGISGCGVSERGDTDLERCGREKERDSEGEIKKKWKWVSTSLLISTIRLQCDRYVGTSVRRRGRFVKYPL